MTGPVKKARKTAQMAKLDKGIQVEDCSDKQTIRSLKQTIQRKNRQISNLRPKLAELPAEIRNLQAQNDKS